jgi:peroxiredoxin
MIAAASSQELETNMPLTVFPSKLALSGIGCALLLAVTSCARTDAPEAAAPAPSAQATQPTVVASVNDVADDATKVQPLAVGDRVPAFVVRRPDSSSYNFDPAARSASAVIIFYRGGWCPYCNVHLGQLKTAETTLRERGYEVLFMSSDRPEIFLSSLKDDIEKDAANYTLLSDSDAAAAKAFRVAFRVDDTTVEKYKGFGIDLEATQGNAQHILPVPAVFVVDKSGTVQFAHFNPDYEKRLSADELLAAAP